MSARIELHFIEADGRAKTITVAPEGSLMEAAVRNDISGITAQCGGALACATCHVFLPSPWSEALGPPGDMEDELLECRDDRRIGSRLSCQIRLRPDLDGMTVELPESQN